MARIHIFAAMVILATAFLGAAAQSPPAPAPAPAPGQDCFNTLLNVSDCLTYVEAGSNLTKPDKNCCPSFAGLVASSPICLCQLLGGGASSLGIQLNISKALKLPTVCHVTTPPLSSCAAVGVPVNAPAESQASSPGQVPPSMSTDTGSTTTPSSKASRIVNFSFFIFVGSLSCAISTLF